jgi:hypothetical protein
VKKIIVILLLAIFAKGLYAQDSTKIQHINKADNHNEKRQRINTLLKLEEEQEPAFRKHGIFGFKAASDGYGISWELGKYNGIKKATIYQVELNEKKHPKEEKTAWSQNYFGQVNSIVWAKANNFFQFKLGMGQQYLLGGKANKNGVNVYAVYAGGASLGLLKPYYLNVQLRGGGTGKATYDTIFAHPADYNIDGASGVFYGWKDVKIKPGVHAKLAMRFDYGRFNESITAIEAGINGEYYFNDIRQIILNTNKHFFFNGYVSIMFGRRRGLPKQ